jgi:hypothetical protein
MQGAANIDCAGTIPINGYRGFRPLNLRPGRNHLPRAWVGYRAETEKLTSRLFVVCWLLWWFCIIGREFRC